MQEQSNKKVICSANASWYLWNFRRNLLHRFQEDGFEVSVTSSRDKYTDRLSCEYEITAMKHLSRTGMNPLRDVLLLAEYLRVYKKQKPALVFNFTIKPNIYSSIACGILGISCVSTVTGLGYSFLKEGLLQKITVFLYKISLRKNKFVVFQNQDDLDLFVSKRIIPKEKAMLIEGSGIDTLRFSPSKENIRTGNLSFILVARLLRDKGVVEFVEAARIVRGMIPHAQFRLLGQLDHVNPAAVSRRELDEWIEEGIVEYLGEVNDVVPHLKNSDVIVLPSYREGLPKSILEGMAMGMPVIATDIPGSRSVVSHGTSGFLAPVKNSNALAEIMIDMARLSTDERTRMGDIGRKMVLERFDEKIIVKAYEALAQKILGNA
ncbi:MAG: glycosyltransferase [Patescibacteria group bacterium]|nr:glycosyltransferase [Patescibacteria group bacterium]